VRLYLVRHGAAENATGRCIGHCDIALSAAGAAAIERVAPLVTPAPDRIIASDLARARASASLLAQHWRRPITIDARLREMQFGEWDGLAWTEIERRDPDRLAAWMADWVRVRAPGGESFEDVVARVGEWFAELQASAGDETVVVVAHAGAIRALFCLWLAAPLDWAFRFRVEPAGVSILIS
jgi:alpha-ribazole phosphatase